MDTVDTAKTVDAVEDAVDDAVDDAVEDIVDEVPGYEAREQPVEMEVDKSGDSGWKNTSEITVDDSMVVSTGNMNIM